MAYEVTSFQVERKGKFDLRTKHGPLIGGGDLTKVLGYKSQEAFRQALRRGTLPVTVFELEGRRGKFALTDDIENWLSTFSLEQKGGEAETDL